MTLAARVVQASLIIPGRSYGTRSPFSERIVRPTTRRIFPTLGRAEFAAWLSAARTVTLP
jgi:hypothetical protein